MTNVDELISVIIPVYNDPEGLKTTVESLMDQSASNFEIIIADNGSTDETAEIAAGYAQLSRVSHVIADEKQGSYVARNAGIEAAEGDILAFIDADMWVESDWLTLVQERMNSTGAAYLGCNVKISTKSDTLAAQYNKLNGFPVEDYIQNNNFVPTCCLVVRRQLFETIGTFDSSLISGGDVEFGHRVHDAGYSQEFADDIIMYHPARSSLLSLMRKYYRIGRGSIQRSQNYHDFSIRHPIHPFNFLPVRPSYIRKKFADEPISRQVIFFHLAYILKLSNTTGRLREWIASKR